MYAFSVAIHKRLLDNVNPYLCFKIAKYLQLANLLVQMDNQNRPALSPPSFHATIMVGMNAAIMVGMNVLADALKTINNS
ncbi:hypothetical protein E2I00_010565 [Balaenoptera physalus]|uniref:Uncharacterized protein n=1 Tax=Balaenoptera physalus TaxID=9770 RepID=A0A643C0G0_BALPH|nr:hypothetical protein E2I00_010565 [Balaenoptera physalus]